MGVTASLALGLVPASLQSQPLFFCVYDTIAPKSGKKFEDVSKLFDHAAHNGSNYLNGHCFVSLMLCVPVWKDSRVTYLSIPLGYRIWQKKETKLQMAASMVRQAMPVFGKFLESPFHWLAICCIIESVMEDDPSGRRKSDL